MYARHSILLLAVALLAGCGSAVHRFPDRPVVWADPDMNNVKQEPEEYWSGPYWDAVDQTLFKPIQRGLALTVAPPSRNVNAWDEVPDSSWFQNRIGVRPMSATELARGPCNGEVLDPAGPWTIVSGKSDGLNLGFVVRDPKDRKWLVKFEGHEQPERPLVADVVGSRVYHAAGYFAPCDTVVFFEPSILKIDPKAHVTDKLGREELMTDADLTTILGGAEHTKDGQTRAMASLFVPGHNLGPWTYQGTRKDDPNDVIPHEDRRELRGARILAAWLDHIDQREGNTVAMWTQEGGRSFVKHWIIDWGDSLGTVWTTYPLVWSKGFGYSYYFDFAHIFEDYVTLGIAPRPYYRVKMSTDTPFGYLGSVPLDPERWKPGLPNPAFLRMTPEDGAWMARIIARFDDEGLAAMIAEARLSNPAFGERLRQILSERRQAVLSTYLRVRSPLADFRLEGDTLCFTDLATVTGVIPSATYSATRYADPFKKAASTWTIDASDPSRVCTPLKVDAGKQAYAIVDLVVNPKGEKPLPPARIHVATDGSSMHLVGIERPGCDGPPGK